jgi:hypothetical protein
VPAEIRDYDATERFAAMYGENFGREGLTPLQEAWAYQQALNRKGPNGKKLFTQRSLAERLGSARRRSPSTPASSSCPSTWSPCSPAVS